MGRYLLDVLKEVAADPPTNSQHVGSRAGTHCDTLLGHFFFSAVPGQFVMLCLVYVRHQDSYVLSVGREIK